MRKAINENPKVQAGVIVGLILAGILLFMKMGKQDSASPAANTPPTASADAAAVGATGAGAVPPAPGAAGSTATAVSSTATSMPAAPAAAGVTVSPEALEPGPGLPADVANAFKRGDAVVLLIVKEGATDDEMVLASVEAISKPGVAVFVAPANKIARYSRIAQGLGVSRVPALIVIRPRDVGGEVPQGVVSYGFRNKQSVVQAVDDALYSGRDDVPYHPG